MINVTKENSKINVESPYNPEFISEAKKIGGRWNPSLMAWQFSATIESNVRELLVEVYGTDGQETETVTALVRLSGNCFDQDVWQLGRRIAWRDSKKSPVRLGHGVTIVSGSFESTGGTNREPVIGANDVVVRVTDAPKNHPDFRMTGWVTVETSDVDAETVAEGIADAIVEIETSSDEDAESVATAITEATVIAGDIAEELDEMCCIITTDGAIEIAAEAALAIEFDEMCIAIAAATVTRVRKSIKKSVILDVYEEIANELDDMCNFIASKTASMINFMFVA